MTKTTNKDEFILEVTQAEYDEAMAKGWNDDDIQKPGKHRFRRATKFANPEDMLPENISVGIRIPLDVLNYFEEKSLRNDCEDVEKYIEIELRKIIKLDLSDQQIELKQTMKNMALDKDFIKIIAKEVKELIAA